MIPELGQFALVIAAVIALVQGTLPLVGAAKRIPAFMALARPAAQGQLVFVAFAFGCLAWSFYSNDFSVLNVATNSNSRLPTAYRIAATWGSHEGSLLLWVLMLSVWMLAVSVFSRALPEDMLARILGVMGLVSLGFLCFMLFTSSPFERLLPAAQDGRDLNPLLQDPGMVFHPPMLYMGYVGFSVAFAFAIAALLDGRLDASWARWSRPWTTAAWMFLTLGIALGSFWAYYELGWGGWWFWDPVENASLMPWLLGTALLHSALVLERRGALVSWTILLAILTFSLSLVGTFLVRSGILTSVHAFAVDPQRGVFILGILTVTTGASLALYAWRAPSIRAGALFQPLSREGGVTLNNLFLAVLTATVFLGTFSPVFIEMINGDKISVGPPYYALTFAPLAIPLLFLVVFGPMLNWKRDELRKTAARLKVPAIIAGVVLVAALPFGGLKGVMTAGALALSAWLLVGSATILGRRWWAGRAYL
ncbi:MAG: heme lyase CcmF/NrfE family subunit, partial [Burkholderiales bacterium]